VDPFQNLNRHIAEQSDQLTKRDQFVLSVFCALVSHKQTNYPEEYIDSSIRVADKILAKLKEPRS